MRIASAVVLLSCGAAALAVETPPAPSAPKNFQVPAKSERALGNGLQLTFVEFGSIPKTTITAVVRAGNLNEGNNTWLADLTGELMKEGAGARSANQLAEAAASMGGAVNLSVGPDQTSISLDVLSEHGEEAVAMIADLLRRPQLPESELARIKRDFGRQLALSRSQPDSLANETFLALLYPNHPYGKLYPTDAQLAAYTIDQVRAFHHDNFGATRTHIYVAGRFERAKIERAIEQGFGDWAAGAAQLVNPPTGVSKRQIKLIDRPGAPQSTIYLGLPAIDPSQPEYLQLSLTNSLLGGEFSSRITSNIRESKGYAYSPQSSLDVQYRSGYWIEEADVTTEHTGDSLQEIYAEIDRLQREPPSPQELAGMQNYRAGVFVLQNATRGALIGQLAYMDLHGLPDDYLTHLVERIYAITPDQVGAAARKYIRPQEMTLVIVGDLAKVRPQLAKVPQLKGLSLQ
ncbi:MAG TPA: pitrilysin family protein [Steroidobacteraceae bacterium]|nr:pitrilysin family protein [Steroidobacteraceae bacterium]